MCKSIQNRIRSEASGFADSNKKMHPPHSALIKRMSAQDEFGIDMDEPPVNTQRHSLFRRVNIGFRGQDLFEDWCICLLLV